MSHTIFYFTGTGNSLKIARDIAEKQKQASVVSIAKCIDNVADLRPEGTVGVVFPVYYCGLPQIVREFLSKITLVKADYIYVIATHGVTGGNGGCLSQAKKLLASQGKKLNAGFYIKSVDNFIVWSWDVPAKEKQSALLNGAHKKALKISQMVQARKDYIEISCMEYLGPVIFRYQHFVKTVNTSDQAFYSTHSCTSCGLCAKVCPTNNIDCSTGKPRWKGETCQRCFACLHLCPTAAIQYGKITLKRQRYQNPYIKIETLINQ